MINDEYISLYYNILGLQPGASLSDIKKSYRKLVRIYHPDLSSAQDKEKNNAIMIRLNEAYQSLAKSGEHESSVPGENVPHTPSNVNVPNVDVGQGQYPAKPKDPAYTYYKQAHLYFHRGFYKFYRKKMHAQNMLVASQEILSCFQKAYPYYKKVVEEYPDCPWISDARFKMQKIRKLTPIYSSILLKLEKALKEEELKRGSAKEYQNSYQFKEMSKNFLHIWEINKL